MIRVLFVCLGNICRSPMAEALFRDLIIKDGLSNVISVDSAGTGKWHLGQPPHEGTLSILKRHGITCEGLTGRLIKKEDLIECDYIIAMDKSNVQNIKAMAPQGTTHKIQLLLDYLPDVHDKNVPDPFYTGGFEGVFDLVEAGTKALLEHIKQEEKIEA